MKTIGYLVPLAVTSLFLITSCNNGKKEQANESPLTPTEKIDSIASEITDRFNAPEKFREGLKSIEVNNKFGFVDEGNNIVIEPKYDAVGVFSEGLVFVVLNNKYGYINHSGEIVIEPQYDDANFFSQGLSAVSKDGKYGYINKQGEVVIDFIYDYANPFYDANGFAAVRKNGKEGLIDRTGRIIMPIEYEYAYSTSDGVAIIFNGNQEIQVFNNGSYKVISY